jgi:uncharacterized OB-fold protein
MSKQQPADGASERGPEQTYFHHLRSGTWRVPKCSHCGTVAFYPRVHCLCCGAEAFDWIAPAGTGTVHATTVMRRPAEAGGDQNLCLIDLDEGFRMMSRIDAADPATPQVGDRVRAQLQASGEERLVVFTLMEKQA